METRNIRYELIKISSLYDDEIISYFRYIISVLDDSGITDEFVRDCVLYLGSTAYENLNRLYVNDTNIIKKLLNEKVFINNIEEFILNKDLFKEFIRDKKTENILEFEK